MLTFGIWQIGHSEQLLMPALLLTLFSVLIAWPEQAWHRILIGASGFGLVYGGLVIIARWPFESVISFIVWDSGQV